MLMVKRVKRFFSNAIDLLSVLELEHTMSDIISSECTNVDQVIVDSLVENCNKIIGCCIYVGNVFHL